MSEIKNDASDANESETDIVFSFDTTGSMASVIDAVRANLVSTVDRLFADIPSIRIGIITHGDYCDIPHHISTLDLCGSDEKERVKAFIAAAQNTGGGDYPECYELVLRSVQQFSWRASSKTKVLVLIGDATPHLFGEEIARCYSEEYDSLLDQGVLKAVEKPPHVPRNNNNLFSRRLFDTSPFLQLQLRWQDEAQKCKDKGINVFSCHALPEDNEQAAPFYTQVAEISGGLYIPLYELARFQEYMVAICLRAADGAQDSELLKQHLASLAALAASAKSEEERQQIAEEQKEVSAAIQDSLNTCFTASVSQTAKKVRRQLNLRSRTDFYEEECNASSNGSARNLMNVLQSREGFETPAKSAVSSVRRRTLSPEASKHDEEDPISEFPLTPVPVPQTPQKKSRGYRLDFTRK